MKKIYIYLLFVVIGISPIYSQTTLTQANEAYGQEDYIKAIELYEQTLREQGVSSDLYYNLGNPNVRKRGCADEPECTGWICEDRRDGQLFGSSRGTVSFAVSAFAADPHAGGAAAV